MCSASNLAEMLEFSLNLTKSLLVVSMLFPSSTFFFYPFISFLVHVSALVVFQFYLVLFTGGWQIIVIMMNHEMCWVCNRLVQDCALLVISVLSHYWKVRKGSKGSHRTFVSDWRFLLVT